jgi:hypothetical protein
VSSAPDDGAGPSRSAETRIGMSATARTTMDSGVVTLSAPGRPGPHGGRGDGPDRVES